MQHKIQQHNAKQKFLNHKTKLNHTGDAVISTWKTGRMCGVCRCRNSSSNTCHMDEVSFYSSSQSRHPMYMIWVPSVLVIFWMVCFFQWVVGVGLSQATSSS